MSLLLSYPAQAKFTVNGLAPEPGWADNPRHRGGLLVGVGVIVGIAVGVEADVGVLVAVAFGMHHPA